MQSIKNKIIKKISKIMICCTTFNMNTTSKHKVNRKSQEKAKTITVYLFYSSYKMSCLYGIQNNIFHNHDNRYFLKYIETQTYIPRHQ